MYPHYFGLKEASFSITPDPHYLFLSEQHREALAHLLYGASENGGFVLLSGEVGTGKTTVCRAFLEQLPEGVEVALVVNPALTAIELMHAICDEFGLTVPKGESSAKALLDRLNRFLLEAHADGRHPVLIIDEAQNLRPKVLEQIRLLTNLETTKAKLLQIFLIGQPELKAMLASAELRQLNQRITARFHLRPLDARATAAYIEHRIAVAGVDRPLFTVPALRAVNRHSGGVPRLINLICDRALLGAAVSRRIQVTPDIVRRAAREVHGERATRPARLPGALALAASLLLAAGLGAWLGASGRVTTLADRLAVLLPTPAEVPPPEPAAALATAVPTRPDPAPPAITATALTPTATRQDDPEPANDIAGQPPMPLAAVISATAPEPPATPDLSPPVADPTVALDRATPATSPTVALDRAMPAPGPTVALDRAMPAPSPTVALDRPTPAAGPTVALERPTPVAGAQGTDADATPTPIAQPTPAQPALASSDTTPPAADASQLPTGGSAPRIALARVTTEVPELDARALPDVTMTAAAAVPALLAHWRVSAPTGVGCNGLPALGFACERAAGRWNDLRRFDRPAVLRLQLDGRQRYVLVTGLDEEFAIVTHAGKAARVPVATLDEQWSGDFLMLWRPPVDGVRNIGGSASGPAVQWLRARLAALPGAELVASGPDHYDVALSAAVRRFQSAHGLSADGIAGPRTLILLDNVLAATDVPRLSQNR